MNIVTPRSKKATKDEQARYAALKELNCIVCHLDGQGNVICGRHEIHHLTSGGRRIGNDKTIPLGAYHHRGVILNGYTGKRMEIVFGPSFAKSKRAFETRFGTEEYLLEQTNKLLGEV